MYVYKHTYKKRFRYTNTLTAVSRYSSRLRATKIAPGNANENDAEIRAAMDSRGMITRRIPAHIASPVHP